NRGTGGSACMPRPRSAGTPASSTRPDASRPPADSPFASVRRARPAVAWSVLGAVSARGLIGALARHMTVTAWPPGPDGFPWATFVINVSGCLLIGVLMVAIDEVLPGRRILRPFLGTGVLGGYTTFSTYIVDAQQLLNRDAAGTALVYLAATLVSALLAVFTGSVVARTAIALARRTREQQT